MTQVTVYSTGPACQRCRLTCQRLDALGIRYDLVDIHDEHNAAVRRFLVEELGYREAPIVQAGDSRWAGFRPDFIDGVARGLGIS
ncbi:glutaredoxin family protein [Microbacterium sp.]|uniref:glutaredoxin family protein n=1 Tax=Microbacterium sp. TaxID=51671 RepID=UPI0028ACB68E|nr:glutaredoxin family protein [Microbacterium sp.]